MPEISRFLGIIISMNYNDHAPPHFHARYGDDQAIIDIETPHREELLEDWRLARASAPLKRIAPLA